VTFSQLICYLFKSTEVSKDNCQSILSKDATMSVMKVGVETSCNYQSAFQVFVTPKINLTSLFPLDKSVITPLHQVVLVCMLMNFGVVLRECRLVKL